MGNITRLLALIKKEQLELIRDQRSLLATFAYALFGPLLLFVLIKGLIATATEEIQVTVGIQQDSRYQQALADVRHYLETQNITTVSYSGPLPQSLSDTETNPAAPQFDVLLKVSQPLGSITDDAFVISVYGDKSTEESNKKMTMASELMQRFVTQQQQDAILKQGIVATHRDWTMRNHVVNNQSVASNRLMESLLIFLLLAPFFITLNYINDATAGERERGSLLPLLTQPASRSLLVLSKWSVGSILGIVGSVVTMLLGFKLIADLPTYEIGLHLDASMNNMLLTTAVIAPLALMVAAIQMLIALTAKSFKEGQSYLTLFSFIPTIVVFMSAKFEGMAFSGITPLVGHQQILQDIFSQQGFDFSQYLGLSLTCLAITAASLMAVKQQMNSEKILQGR